MGRRSRGAGRSLGDQRLRAVSPNRPCAGAFGSARNRRQRGRNPGAGIRSRDHAARGRSGDRRGPGNPHGQRLACGDPSARRLPRRNGRAQRSGTQRTLVRENHSSGARQRDGGSRQTASRPSRSRHGRCAGVRQRHYFRRQLGSQRLTRLGGPRRSQSRSRRAIETPASWRAIGHGSEYGSDLGCERYLVEPECRAISGDAGRSGRDPGAGRPNPASGAALFLAHCWIECRLRPPWSPPFPT